MNWLDDPVDYNEDDDIEEVVAVKILEVIRETPKAWEGRLITGFSEYFPKNQCTFDPVDMTMTMPHWLAVKKGFADAIPRDEPASPF